MHSEACEVRRRNLGLLLLFAIPFAPHPLLYGNLASVCGIRWQELSHTTRFQSFPGVVVVVVVLVFVLALVAVVVMVLVVIVVIAVVVILAVEVLMAAVVMVVVFVLDCSVIDWRTRSRQACPCLVLLRKPTVLYCASKFSLSIIVVIACFQHAELEDSGGSVCWE